MPSKMTTEQFIEKAKTIHGDKYDYSKVEYIDNLTPVTIICPIHGEFQQRPHNHLIGKGCALCGKNYMTTEEFIRRASQVHDNRYDYSKTIYKNQRTKVTIIDPVYGEFQQLPDNHLSGQGHPTVGHEKNAVRYKALDTQSVIECFHIAHPEGGYDYSKVKYVDSTTPVTVICNKLNDNGVSYGEFQITPEKHLQGYGHPQETGIVFKSVTEVFKEYDQRVKDLKPERKYNNETFIQKAKEKHGDKYDYSKVNYVNSQTHVTIICPIHGEFQQKPNHHLSGQGCPKCNRKQTVIYPKHEDRFPIVEGKKYVAVDPKTDFVVDYPNGMAPITIYLKKTYGIVCPFSNFKARNYFKMHNRHWWEDYLEIRLVDDIKKETIKCPYCDWTTVDINNRSGSLGIHCRTQHNIDEGQIIKDYPEYKDILSNSKSIDLRTEEEYTICEICGKKLARINSAHLQTHGISMFNYKNKYRTPTISQSYYKQCVNQANHMNLVNGLKNDNDLFTSSAEKEIKDYFINLGVSCKKNRSILNGKELDLFFTEHNIAIEYNGCKWHTEWFGRKDKHYHYNKMIECNDKGVRLIHIFEDEYMYHKEIVLSKIEHTLGIHQNLPKVGARKCTITKINKCASDIFLNTNHIQGEVSASVYYGAFTPEGDLAAVMTFVKRKDNEYELNRFATNNRMVVSGIADRILKHFIKEHNPSKIISFADRRWTTDLESNLYTKLGFTLEYCTKPDYHYYNEKVDRFQRFHKFGFRKQQLHNKYGFDMSMTEEEMVRELGYDRIWDCGLAKYTLTL